MYCQYHLCNYEPEWLSTDNRSQPTSATPTSTTDSEMKFRVNVCGLHRLPVQEFLKYVHVMHVYIPYWGWWGGGAYCSRESKYILKMQKFSVCECNFSQITSYITVCTCFQRLYENDFHKLPVIRKIREF